MIHDEEEARRLARSIVSDAVLYGGEAALGNPTTRKEIHDLFLSRVAPSLHHVLRDELDRRAAGGASEPRPGTGVEVVGSTGPMLFVALGVALFVLVAGAAFLLAAR